MRDRSARGDCTFSAFLQMTQRASQQKRQLFTLEETLFYALCTQRAAFALTESDRPWSNKSVVSHSRRIAWTMSFVFNMHDSLDDEDFHIICVDDLSLWSHETEIPWKMFQSERSARSVIVRKIRTDCIFGSIWDGLSNFFRYWGKSINQLDA